MPGAVLDAQPRIVIEDRCAPEIVDRIIHEAEPFLRRAATSIASDFPSVADDMIQEARITLWQLDVSRYPQSEVRYLERILYTRMIRVYWQEWRGGLTSGWSKHRRHTSRRRRVASDSRSHE
jgi:DNA-directed RNA polymerase specialized sigma24 family protein